MEAINNSASVLQALIGDILDLSKIDAGKLELKKELFDVRDTVLDVCRVLENQAFEKRIELICHIEHDVPERLMGDELRISQVLYNLIGNAVKFTSQWEVVVSTSLQGPHQELPQPHVIITVRDTGIGIPEDKLPHIFDSFWQADSTTTRRYGGTGLGTRIACDLTRLMGGFIGVESKEGAGSCFRVRLPVLGENPVPPPVPPRVLAGRQVLCIEHNASAALVLQDALETAGMSATLLDDVDVLPSLGAGTAETEFAVLCDLPRGIDLPGIAARVREFLGFDIPLVFLHYPMRPITGAGDNAMVLSKPFGCREMWLALEQLATHVDVPASEQIPARRKRPSSGARVLVAEDDSINAKLIQSLLVRDGHQVTLMRDGEAALQAAKSGHYDLALIDLRMPRMDGVDFTRAYRAYEQASPQGQHHMPIVALTANAAEEARDQCLAAGMDEFLTKPIDPDTLPCNGY